MDEPLSNLDARLRVEMRAEISRIQREVGGTTIYVTHDQVEAMTMGDRVAVLRKGRLQQVADPQRCSTSPANLFVASFIGSPQMNLAAGEVERDGDRLALRLGEQRVPLPHEPRRGAPRSRRTPASRSRSGSGPSTRRRRRTGTSSAWTARCSCPSRSVPRASSTWSCPSGRSTPRRCARSPVTPTRRWLQELRQRPRRRATPFRARFTGSYPGPPGPAGGGGRRSGQALLVRSRHRRGDRAGAWAAAGGGVTPPRRERAAALADGRPAACRPIRPR